MTGNKIDPQSALSKLIQSVHPNILEYNLFKTNLNKLLSQYVDSEFEGHLTSLLRDFLKDTFYKNDFYINSKAREDLVIHCDASNKSPVGVLFEIKRPSNKTEMISTETLNCKAFHEAILYYLRERFEEKNIQLKYIVITNLFEWFVFDASDFERLVTTENQGVASLKKQYENWKSDKLINSKTDLFYNEIAKPFLANYSESIDYVHFTFQNLASFENPQGLNDEKFIPIFKILSPKYLLKEIVINDNNTLNKGFYFELLYILGLEEIIENGKPIIKQQKNRIKGTLIENTITQIKIKNNIADIKNIENHGDTEEEQIFSIALELIITWLNRILFLKLLEAQLVAIHNGNKDEYAFLNTKKKNDFGELNKLFFQVLAVKIEQRDDKIKLQYANIPYLNSSLFEPTELEKQTVFISQLDNNETVPLFKTTIFIDENFNRVNGFKPVREYLLEFLDAYNFTSEPAATFTENSNNLINSAVLGLIFEKINGYKEGAFFTPGYISMYMCRQAIRRTVIDKFRPLLKLSETLDFTESWTELQNKITKVDDKLANEIIESIKICDPSVGSGHFLVSALNEMLCIKSELGILCSKSGKNLSRLRIEIEKDELVIVQDLNTEFEKHEYYRKKSEYGEYIVSKSSQEIQETIFNEKRKIIENCLFGVDINYNSVQITRLRLWIELLKHTYYTDESNHTELKTLPNIDINIKHGNSLLSRFNVNVDLKEVFKNGYNIATYMNQTEQYLNTTDSKVRNQLKKKIDEIIDNYVKFFVSKAPLEIKINKVTAELMDLTNPIKMFTDELPEYKEQRKLRIINLSNELEKLTEFKRKNEKLIRQRKSFEWRIQFAKLLDVQTAEFTGFDVVVGNPPYIKEYDSRHSFDGLHELPEYQGKMDLWYLFGSKGLELLKENGYLCYIAPNNWTTNSGASKFRNYIINNSKIIQLIDFGAYFVFDSSSIQTMIMMFQKDRLSDNYAFDYRQISVKNPKFEIALKSLNKENTEDINYLKPFISREDLLNQTIHFSTNEVDTILAKILKAKNFSFFEKSNSKNKIIAEIGQGIVTPQDNINRASYQKLNEVANGIHPHHDKVSRSMLDVLGKNFNVGDGIFVLTDEEKNKIPFTEDELKLVVPNFTSEELKKYYANSKNNLWLIYTDSGFKSKLKILKYPNIKTHLDKYASVITSDNKPYGLHRSREQHLFIGEKILSLRKCETPTFTYCNFDCFVLAEFYVIQSKRINLKYLTGLLNSKLIAFWLKYRGKMQGAMFQIDKEPIMNLPIVNINNEYSDKIIENVDKIIKLKSKNPDSDITELEKEINSTVYKIYNLNNSEIETIENAKS